ncbi:hypothetical protein GCM10027361_00450 [Erwinia aphidicola]|uniref:hypothetical protein n=1 Tax=Erwinia aphidicola TaxID=68334 RepID=UPI00174747EC|nr:hypothetical protein [Erwinia aphidicola]MBD1377237.1 hypothetical protein [Erwinia aphidicola]
MSVRWNGAGIPQSGDLVDLMDDSQSQTWGDVTIKFYGEQFAVWDDHGEECSNGLCNIHIRPILTEAERKRENIAEALVRFLDKETNLDNPYGKHDVHTFIDYIEAGEIPGVRLADD